MFAENLLNLFAESLLSELFWTFSRWCQ